MHAADGRQPFRSGCKSNVSGGCLPPLMLVVRLQSHDGCCHESSRDNALKTPGLVSEGQRPGNSASITIPRPGRAELGRVLPFQGKQMLVGRVPRPLAWADDWLHLWCDRAMKDTKTIAEQADGANRRQPLGFRGSCGEASLASLLIRRR